MSNKIKYLSVIILLAIAAYFFLPAFNESRLVNSLIERNLDARGGKEAWDKVNTLKLSGRMEIGQSTHVPYVLDQQRPTKMCIEFTFDKQKTMQCSDGDKGWKSVPFRGRTKAELLTKKEFNETADAADLYGLLSGDINTKINYVGLEQLSNRNTHKLKITLPKGSVKYLYLDDETGLEVRLDTSRLVGGEKRTVTTLYSDWKSKDGLLISHRQDTQTAGDENSHFMTVDTVEVNPVYSSSQFELPSSLVKN